MKSFACEAAFHKTFAAEFPLRTKHASMEQPETVAASFNRSSLRQFGLRQSILVSNFLFVRFTFY